MKKTISVLITVLVLCLTVGTFLACGGGITAEQITKAFEDEGYTVSSEELGGITSIIAVKETDLITVIICKDEDEAKTLKTTYDVSAGVLGVTCNIDGKVIYFGTAAAVAIYEKI